MLSRRFRTTAAQIHRVIWLAAQNQNPSSMPTTESRVMITRRNPISTHWAQNRTSDKSRRNFFNLRIKDASRLNRRIIEWRSLLRRNGERLLLSVAVSRIFAR